MDFVRPRPHKWRYQQGIWVANYHEYRAVQPPCPKCKSRDGMEGWKPLDRKAYDRWELIHKCGAKLYLQGW